MQFLPEVRPSNELKPPVPRPIGYDNARYIDPAVNELSN
jgi:hypothetical protein